MEKEAKQLIEFINSTEEKNFIVTTGERGMLHFLESLENTDITLDIEYRDINDVPIFYFIRKGLKVIGRIYIDPMFDDRGRNKLMDKRGGVRSSYEYYIYNLNIKIENN